MTFTLRQETPIPEINSLARLYRHAGTGARLLSLINSDENKAFGITFRTIPASSNGIAHIMEHSVLCGSRKYRVKEPFVELVKGSLKTFLNAMTFPDKTCYPVASTNLQDFYNLIDVYLDAVFYPLLKEQTLSQEGWHYELASPDSPLSYKGVVFNEMKGNYSSPDTLISYEYSQRSLFPDTAYGLDSGGDPAVIPDLGYAEFRSFHETFYHPSNAYIWFYGDDPEQQRLEFLDAWLAPFGAAPAAEQVRLQPAWDAPRRERYQYDPGGAPDAKSFLTVNWLLPENKDPQTAVGLSILSHILTATPASPLRKSLLDSGLGEDLAGAGFEESLRQMFYSVGMKGVAEADLPKVEALILETLTDLSARGFDPETVAASMNTVEFRLREQNTGQFPRGLAIMFAALSTWLYDGDPIQGISFEAPLDAVKGRLAAGDRYFEGLIRQYLLENPHRATVTLEPDEHEGERREQAESSRLDAAKTGMSQADLQTVMARAEELRRLQETPDAPEALASLPYLKLSDLERQVKTIPLAVIGLNASRDAGQPQILFHDLPTNGILYLDLGFNLRALPADLIPFAGLFGRLLLEMGTQAQDYVALTQRIGRETGGIWSSSLTSAAAAGSASATRQGRPASELWLFLRGKAVTPKSVALLDILGDVLRTAALDNQERFRQIVHEEKAGLESALVPSGHGLVNSRLHARLTESGWVSEQMGGIAQLFFLRELSEALERDWGSVLDKLERIRALLINRGATIVNATTDAASWQGLAPRLDSFLDSLPSASLPLQAYPPGNGPSAQRPGEGLTIPAQVNYVGQGFSLYSSGYRLHGSALVASKYLRATYMWEKVRVQGGAYGGYSLFDLHSGVFTFLSYRDPNLLATLDTYRGAAEFLRGLELTEGELTKAIIGTISDIDAYLLPDAKGWVSMTRHLIGYTDAMRQQVRDEVLGTTSKDLRAFGQALAEAARRSELVVLGSAEAIQKANSERAGLFEVKKVM